MNLYRGCTHGCIYCDSRSECYGMDHEFEDVAVKFQAPGLLDATLSKKRKRCMIGTGSMSDPYNSAEIKYRLMHQCLEIISKHGFGVSLLTKSDLVLEDLPLIRKINASAKAVVQVTITTADDNLCRIIEPNVTRTSGRAHILHVMKEEGIPTIIWLSPILPFINDTKENIEHILSIARENKVYGIICFGMGLTLRDRCRDYFYSKLDISFPGLKERYERKYGSSYSCLSDNNHLLMDYFHNSCKKAGMLHTRESCFAYLHEFPERDIQPDFFL